MKAFQIVPAIGEYKDFGVFAKEAGLGESDLILTNEYIYDPVIAKLNLPCHTLFQEQYGAGEPSDIMIDSILEALRGKSTEELLLWEAERL